MTQLYWVDEETADDPEANSHRLMSAPEIWRDFPWLEQIIVGNGMESLDLLRELWLLKIRPAEDSEAFDYEPKPPVSPLLDYDTEPTFASRYITAFDELAR